MCCAWEQQQPTLRLAQLCSYCHPRAPASSSWKSFPEHFPFQRSTAYQSYVCLLSEPPQLACTGGKYFHFVVCSCFHFPSCPDQGRERSGVMRLWAAGYPSAAWAALSSSLKVGNAKVPSWKAAGKGLGVMVSAMKQRSSPGFHEVSSYF